VRRRQVEPVLAEVDGLPECFRASRCVEVWSPGGSGVEAMSAYSRGRSLWLAEHGLDWHTDRARLPPALVHSGTPWSFDFLADQPERRAQLLRARGLPLGWVPTPAPARWRVARPARVT